MPKKKKGKKGGSKPKPPMTDKKKVKGTGY